MSKYDRLGVYLREQGKDYVPMTFAEIERVVGFALPKSQAHQAWWSNSTSNNLMTQVWLDAGYRTEQVDMVGRKLVFRRVADADRTRGMQEDQRMFNPSTETREKVTRHPAIGALKGMFTIEPGYDIAKSDPEIVAEWEDAIDRKADLYESGRTKK